MTNGWSGGQYSLLRGILGTYCLLFFFRLMPAATEPSTSQGAVPLAGLSRLFSFLPDLLDLGGAPWFVTALLASGALASLFFIVGYGHRLAALWLWYLLACLFARHPWANPGFPLYGWVFLFHLFLPPAPYGSWTARGRVDPGGGWRMPRYLFAAAWGIMALTYASRGLGRLLSPSWVDGTALVTLLESPGVRWDRLGELLLQAPPEALTTLAWLTVAAELLFAPLSLVRRLRPFLWLAMWSAHLGFFTLVGLAHPGSAMILVHLLTFDPAWVRPAEAPGTETVFYDGHCGLCHRAVRFLLAEDTTAAFNFAPLNGAAFERAVPAPQRLGLPDTMVVPAADGRLLIRSQAAIHMLKRLGGVWRVAAIVGALVPPMVRDGVYRLVARIRLKLYQRPAGTCPLMPASLRYRFPEESDG